MKKYTIFHAALAALTAILLTTTFLPFGEAINALVALVPLLILVRRLSPRAAAGWCFLAGFLFWGCTLSWFPAICANGGPWPLVVLGWAGLAIYCAAYFALYGFLVARVWQSLAKTSRPTLPRLIAILFLEPVLWAGLEWLRSCLFTGFAWNFLGNALTPMPQFAVPARWGGVFLVSALLVLINGVFATFFLRIFASITRTPSPRTFAARLLQLAETGLPLLIVYLTLQLSHAPIRLSDALRVTLIQRNAPCRFTARHQQNPFDIFGRLMDTATAAEPDLVVWAESAMAEFGDVRSGGARAAAKHMLERAHAHALIAGGNDEEDTPDGHRDYNAAALYTATTNDEISVQTYYKQHLVPFGEFIPFDKTFPVLQALSPIGMTLYPGAPELFCFTNRAGRVVHLAPLICFEDTDHTLARTASRKGAQALVLITNDSWFAHSNEARQHADLAVMRALETGLPVIRVGNSGVSGIIDVNGRTRWLSDSEGHPLTDAAGAMTETVFLPDGKEVTPYTRLGDIPLIVCFALACLMAIAFGWRRRSDAC